MTITLLDGAMGTELIVRGQKLPDHIWSAEANLSNPKLVRDIHIDYTSHQQRGPFQTKNFACKISPFKWK